MSDEIHPFDIRANAEWQRLGWTAESRPPVTVDRSDVPEQFQHLIPYVERWGINCDVIRGDYFEKQPRADIKRFYQAVLPHWEALNTWVDIPPRSQAKLDFMLMLKAYSEAVPPPSPEEIETRRRARVEEREARRKHWKDVSRNPDDRNA
jgi:hypothetical protein